MMQSQTPLIMAPKARSPNRGLWLSIIILGAFGMLIWMLTSGFALAFCFGSYYAYPGVGATLLAIVNVLYTLFTCQVIFIITAVDFPNPGYLRDLRRHLANLTTITIVGFSLNVASITLYIIWSSGYYYISTANDVLLGCSFSYLWTIIIIPIVAVYETKTFKRFALAGAVPLAHHSGIQHIPMTNYPPVSSYYVNPVASTSYPNLVNPVASTSYPSLVNQVAFTSHPHFVNPGISTSYPNLVNLGASTSYPHLVGPVPATSTPYSANASAQPSAHKPATVNNDVSNEAPSPSGTSNI